VSKHQPFSHGFVDLATQNRWNLIPQNQIKDTIFDGLKPMKLIDQGYIDTADLENVFALKSVPKNSNRTSSPQHTINDTINDTTRRAMLNSAAYATCVDSQRDRSRGLGRRQGRRRQSGPGRQEGQEGPHPSRPPAV
jgi:hypothetical protein